MSKDKTITLQTTVKVSVPDWGIDAEMTLAKAMKMADEGLIPTPKEWKLFIQQNAKNYLDQWGGIVVHRQYIARNGWGFEAVYAVVEVRNHQIIKLEWSQGNRCFMRPTPSGGWVQWEPTKDGATRVRNDQQRTDEEPGEPENAPPDSAQSAPPTPRSTVKKNSQPAPDPAQITTSETAKES